MNMSTSKEGHRRPVHILYISYDGMCESLGQSQVLPYIIELGKSNNRFSLISFEKGESFATRNEHIQSICVSNRINWLPQTYRKSPPILSTLLDLSAMIMAAARLLKNDPFDFVHCRSYIPGLIALRLKRKNNVPFLFDMRGFWADERVDGGIWKLSNPLYKLIFRYFKRKEKQLFNEADHIISLTNKGKNEILSWNLRHVQNDKISVIPCVADFRHFQCPTEKEKEESKRSLGLSPSCRVVTYIGSIGTWYMLDDMLAYFKEFHDSNDNSTFLIITRDDPKAIRLLAQQKGISTVNLIVKAVDREKIPSLMAATDHSVFFILPAYSKLASSPTKMAELLAMGIPIVCNSGVGDVEELVNQLGVGVVLESTSRMEMERAVKQISAFESVSPEQIRRNAINHLSLETGTMKYLNAYKLIGGNLS